MDVIVQLMVECGLKYTTEFADLGQVNYNLEP